MNTLLIKVINPNAYNLLKELEKLHLIKILKTTSSPQIKLSDKFASKLPVADAAKLQEHIKQTRKEWGN